jgi:hypothetical protein
VSVRTAANYEISPGSIEKSRGGRESVDRMPTHIVWVSCRKPATLRWPRRRPSTSRSPTPPPRRTSSAWKTEEDTILEEGQFWLANTLCTGLGCGTAAQ